MSVPQSSPPRPCAACVLALLILLPGLANAQAEGGFLGRLAQPYLDDLAGNTPTSTGPEPPRRGLAAPLASPPFPSAEYPGLTLGGPWSPTQGPLMQALAGTPLGQVLEANRISLYGWASTAGNASTSSRLNAPLGYDWRARRWELNQAVIRAERLPDTAQTERLDWGFRIEGLYGLDYRYTTTRGLLSSQLLKRNQAYGFDPVVFYGEVYVPWVAEGVTIRLGRYYTLPDIESIYGPDNYLHTHSILNSVDAYTQFGALATVRLNQNLTVNLGVSGGNDIAPAERQAKPTFTGCIRYTKDSNADSNQFCVSSLANPYGPAGNVQNYVANTFTHRFTERLHTATEVAYIWQTGAAGGNFAASKAVVNITSLKVSDVGRVTLRNEVFDDSQGGRRTGYASRYSTHTLGYAHYLGANLVLRPEVRVEHAYDARAYDGGKRHTQGTAFLNLVARF